MCRDAPWRVRPERVNLNIDCPERVNLNIDGPERSNFLHLS